MMQPLSVEGAQSGTGRKRLRIAVLNRTFSPVGGGAECYSIAMVEQLASRHEIHVFAQEIDHHWPGVAYHRIAMPLRRPRWVNQLWFAFATWRATRRGFDVVHSHENSWHGDVQTVHVVPVRYNLFQGRTGARRAVRWIKVVTSPRLLAYMLLERARYAARPGRLIVVTSDSLKSVMEQAYPASGPMIRVITPGITMPELPVTQTSRKDARTSLGLPTDGRCLLFVANDYRKKGLEALLNALARLPSDVILAVAGNSAHIPSFRSQAAVLKLVERVFFLGAVKNIGMAYEAADCLVHPTLEDTFAMVVLEAMAHGLPVIVSGPKYCGISGLLQAGINAIILDDPRDASALATAILEVLDCPDFAARLAKEAVAFAKHYQWRELAVEQESLYFRVAREQAPKAQDA